VASGRRAEHRLKMLLLGLSVALLPALPVLPLCSLVSEESMHSPTSADTSRMHVSMDWGKSAAAGRGGVEKGTSRAPPPPTCEQDSALNSTSAAPAQARRQE